MDLFTIDTKGSLDVKSDASESEEETVDVNKDNESEDEGLFEKNILSHAFYIDCLFCSQRFCNKKNLKS
jgi:hypothetical protein